MGRTVLFSLAHPDDESFSGAGLACWCLERGVEVVFVCATRGEMGKTGDAPVGGSPADVGVAREQELRAAARIIGVNHVHLLDYRDRELAAAPADEIRLALVRLLRHYRPAVVISFDPNGFNVHPDHIAVSRFTSDAVAAAADARWFPQAGKPHVVQRLLWTPPIGPWDAARSVDLGAEPGVDFVIDISRWSTRKAEALRAHRTQRQSTEKYFFSQPDLAKILAVECYRQGWGPPLQARPSTDVFCGLDRLAID